MIPTRVHGILDYLVGVLLIAAPYLFGFAQGGPEHWVPALIGAATIVMSLMTRYELSIAKLVPLNLHLGVDLAAGALLLVSPWLFGFAERIWWPHVFFGILAIVVVLLTRRETDYAAANNW